MKPVGALALGSYKSYKNSNGMACFIGILEEFYQEAEPHGNWKGSFVSLSLNSCVFSVLLLHPNVQSYNFLRACLERMKFIA
jgi:hypothetical protein